MNDRTTTLFVDGRYGFWLWTATVTIGTCWAGYAYRVELFANQELSAILRNLALVWGGLTAIGLAVWRSWIANRQVAAAQKQVETALRQIEVAQESHLRDRFQRAAEMLGHDSVVVRIGGVQALVEVADQNMDKYFVTVVNLLEAFAAGSTRLEDSEHQWDRDWDVRIARHAIDVLVRLKNGELERYGIPDLWQDELSAFIHNLSRKSPT